MCALGIYFDISRKKLQRRNTATKILLLPLASYLTAGYYFVIFVTSVYLKT